VRAASFRPRHGRERVLRPGQPGGQRAGHRLAHGQATAISASISTGRSRGSAATPIAERACAPASGPHSSMIRSEKPLMTAGVRVAMIRQCGARVRDQVRDRPSLHQKQRPRRSSTRGCGPRPLTRPTAYPWRDQGKPPLMYAAAVSMRGTGRMPSAPSSPAVVSGARSTASGSTARSSAAAGHLPVRSPAAAQWQGLPPERLSGRLTGGSRGRVSSRLRRRPVRCRRLLPRGRSRGSRRPCRGCRRRP
jgi:hypothetical protein